MALKITLKPGERMLIGQAVIRNGDSKSNLMIENSVPILREKDILGEKDADSPARRIYFTIQLMYIDGKNLQDHHKSYWKLVHDFIGAAPSATGLIDQISERILVGEYYKALKYTKKLITYEQQLLQQFSDSAT
jgi:flagellar protein FlbT